MAIKEGKESYSNEELQSIYDEFNDIFRRWKYQWIKSEIDTNPVYEDERRLLTRFEDENECKQILYSFTDFNVPTTNSRAEVNQRGVKIKQKIGKFRSVDGAEDYVKIRSCILTYKKNKINILESLRSAFLGKTIIV